MAEALEVRLCQPLIRAGVHDGGVKPDAGHPRQLAVRDSHRLQRAVPGDALRPGVPAGLLTAAVTLRRPRSPRQPISLSARHAVGTDATGPNISRWSPITRKSLITRALSAIAHARSANTRPGHGRPAATAAPPTGQTSGPSGPKAAAAARPACDTIPVPPPVTSRPRDHPVAFTQKVLLEPVPVRTSTILIVPVQEHFSIQPRRSPAKPP